MTIEKDVLVLLDTNLGLAGKGLDFGPETRLLGALPTFDSMAIINIITGLEAHFGIRIADDEIEGSLFATVGSLLEFVRMKLDALARL